MREGSGPDLRGPLIFAETWHLTVWVPRAVAFPLKSVCDMCAIQFPLVTKLIKSKGLLLCKVLKDMSNFIGSKPGGPKERTTFLVFRSLSPPPPPSQQSIHASGLILSRTKARARLQSPNFH